MHQVLLILTARRRPIAIFSLTLLLSTAIFIASVFLQAPKNPSSQKQQSMAAARSFVLWLHGLGDSGPANEPIKTLFTSPEFRTTKWSFPSAPIAPVSCNCKPQAISLHIL